MIEFNLKKTPSNKQAKILYRYQQAVEQLMSSACRYAIDEMLLESQKGTINGDQYIGAVKLIDKINNNFNLLNEHNSDWVAGFHVVGSSYYSKLYSPVQYAKDSKRDKWYATGKEVGE